MTNFHIRLRKDRLINLNHRDKIIGKGNAPVLLKEGGSIGISANQPVGIITPSPVSVGGRVHRNVDTLESINFKKEKPSSKRDNIKFIF